MDCKQFVNEYIRLTKENQEKMKNGDIETLNLVNKQSDKFPKKIIIAGDYLIMALAI